MLVCEVSTKFGLYTLMTILETHTEFAPAEQRVLLVSTHTPDPEAHNRLLDLARTSPKVSAMFARVLSLNDLLSPLHPTQWKPSQSDLDNLAMQSILRAVFGAAPGEQVDLMMESVQTPPSNTLARIMSGSDIHIYSDGLMTYGPIRFALPHAVGSRIRGLYYMDFIPGLKPCLLREFAVPCHPIPPARLRATLEAMSEISKQDLNAEGLDGAPVFMGQYLSGLGLCTADEEVDLYVRALNICAVSERATTVFFKPHPTFSHGLLHALKTSPRLGKFELRILDTAPLMEEFLIHFKPSFIASVFSTGLATARELFGIDAYSFETAAFLEKLTPYENSNRVPAALIYYAFSEVTTRMPSITGINLQQKIDLLAAGMQPKILLHSQAEKQAILLLPEDRLDPIETAARARIEEAELETKIPYLQYAALGLGFRDVQGLAEDVPNEHLAETATASAERPLDKAKRLLAAGNMEEAFFISLKALAETPTSTQHMKILNAAAKKLGGLHLTKCEEVEQNHLEAVRAKQAVEAAPEPAFVTVGNGGDFATDRQRWAFQGTPNLAAEGDTMPVRAKNEVVPSATSPKRTRQPFWDRVLK